MCLPYRQHNIVFGLTSKVNLCFIVTATTISQNCIFPLRNDVIYGRQPSSLICNILIVHFAQSHRLIFDGIFLGYLVSICPSTQWHFLTKICGVNHYYYVSECVFIMHCNYKDIITLISYYKCL